MTHQKMMEEIRALAEETFWLSFLADGYEAGDLVELAGGDPAAQTAWMNAKVKAFAAADKMALREFKIRGITTEQKFSGERQGKVDCPF
jgi:hypothetical protein